MFKGIENHLAKTVVNLSFDDPGGGPHPAARLTGLREYLGASGGGACSRSPGQDREPE